MAEELLVSPIGLMPNPANDFIHVELGEVSDHVVSIIDMSGKSVMSTVISGSANANRNLTSLPAGVYLMQVITDGKSTTDRFVIER